MSPSVRTAWMGAGLLCALGASCSSALAERRELAILRIPDKSITIDARENDWNGVGQEDRTRAMVASMSDTLWAKLSDDRGPWAGPDDCSMVATIAVDSKNLYVYADVRDQMLVNTSTPKEPYFGDDFEIFIEAGPAATRFTAKTDNYRQLIFVPKGVNIDVPPHQDIIWEPEKNPGVAVASRLRLWGYSIEVQIPKAIFPHWKERPDLDTIGIELMLSDADYPGVDSPHPSTKGAMYLTATGQHFQTPEKIALGRIDAQPVKHKRRGPDRDAPLLGTPPNNQPGAAAVAAVRRKDNPTRRKFGMFVLAQRLSIEAPVDTLTGILKSPMIPPNPADMELRQYAMMALARRQKLPVNDVFEAYIVPDLHPSLRLTLLWCAGANGDKSISPRLIALLKDPNLRIRMMSAMALGTLADPTAREALEQMAASDPHHYAKFQAQQALDRINAKGADGAGHE